MASRPDSFLYIASEVFVEHSVGAAGFQGRDHLGDPSAAHRRSFHHSDWPAVLFDHNFRFCQTERHFFDYPSATTG